MTSIDDVFFTNGVTVITCAAEGFKGKKIISVKVNGKQYEAESQDFVSGISNILRLYIGVRGRHNFMHGDSLEVCY